MRQKEVLLIIPAYNEEKNIEKVMKQLAQPEIADIVDVLVMNDASSDNTNWLAKEYGCAVVTHVFNLGYGSGLQLGYKYATEGAILMLFRWMRMGSTMCAISRKFTRD